MIPRKILPALLIWLIALCSVATAADATTLTTQGLAPVRIGETIATAERALHAKLGRLSARRTDFRPSRKRAKSAGSGSAAMAAMRTSPI